MRQRRGVFLIYVLFVTVLVTMYLGAAVALGPAGVMRARIDTERSTAREAAQSGVDYALTRLRKDPLWRANGAPGVVIRRPDLVVLEDRGNVIGLIRGGSGEFAQFRLRFNYQDGPAGPDGLDNSGLMLDFRGLSFNNLSGGADDLVPVAEGQNGSVVANAPAYHGVPARAVWLAVEGRCGAGLRDLSETNPNPAARGPVGTVVVEACYKLGSGAATAVQDSVAMAGRGFDTMLPDGTGNVTLSSAAPSSTARIRSNRTLYVRGGTANNLVSDNSAEARFTGPLGNSWFVANSPQGVAPVRDLTTSPFYLLSWAGVRKAQGANRLKGGTYVAWSDGSLHYYDKTLSQYKKYMADPNNVSDAGATPNLPTGMTMVADGDGWKLKITQDVGIEDASLSGQELAIIPRAGAPEGPFASAVNEESFYTQLLNPPTGLVDHPFPSVYTINSPDFARLVRATLVHMDPKNANMPNNTVNLTDPVTNIVYRVNNGDQTVVLNNVPTDNYFAGITFLARKTLNYGHQTGQLGGDDFVGAANAFGAEIEHHAPGAIPNANNDDLDPAKFSLSFEPDNDNNFAAVSGQGNITLGTSVHGSGGSIVTAGDLKIVGLGTDLTANPDAREGVSLFAQGDVAVNTFRKSGVGPNGAPTGEYASVSLKGVVYACRSFTSILGDPSGFNQNGWGKFNLEGCLVAYGGDPASQDPGTDTMSGAISIIASESTMRFDPSYLMNLKGQFPARIVLQKVAWNER